ncbi:serine hydrolase domain-containing protein [Ohtaekwangia koreensis]|uniref:CubicO group peptidase, beta-lactamase class C family n=1 Tax=Ohtaekwangia koreensis TaxID=688867 RepID=A0A1T5M877_9BACT|nr:serine hydrolase domain-containing protein [Ohtaekwangia koreensis]SKC84303.1 CubicO group peptidase, beta-lactamase class C family [Ohtaekwangia koreensis]
MKIRTVSTSIILLLITYNAIAQFPDQWIEKKIDSLFSEYNSETAGVAVVVVKDGKIVFKKGYGMANLEYDIPVTTQTPMHIGSVSKQFTAFSVYLLERQGKISFEDDIRKYIPELPDYGSPIRIKHLLAHTSGLRDQWAIHALAGWHEEDVITTEQILKLASIQKELNFKTGTAFGYCNTGYTLLAEAVSRITGQSFSDFTRANIFEPLGMTNSLFYDDYHKTIKNRAYSYQLKDGKFTKMEQSHSNVGPSNLLTTAEDLAKWVNNFDNPIVGDQALIKAFNEISVLDNNEPVVWAMSQEDTIYHAKGQLRRKHKGLPVISHGGHVAGYRAVLMRFPENNLAVITLSNNEHYTMLGKVTPLIDLYLQDKFIEVPNVITTQSASKTPAEPEKYSNRLTDFEGAYQSDELTTVYRFKIIKDTLIMTHPRLSDMELSPIGKDKFSGVNTFAFELEFIRKGKEVTRFKISNFGAKNVKFKRIK